MNNNAKSMLVLAGDGIGPEVVAEALRVIEWFVDRRGSGGWFLRTGLGLSFGRMVPEVCRTLGVAEQTYYRWHHRRYSAIIRRTSREGLTPSPTCQPGKVVSRKGDVAKDGN